MSAAAARCIDGLRPPIPPPLPGFAQINRFWDTRLQRYVAKVSPGECFVTGAGELIATVLGSCVAACVRDKRSGLGGMNHFMLPVDGQAGRRDPTIDTDSALRYGNFAMEHLLNQFFSRGARRLDLEVKAFGGGHVMQSTVRVGDKNIEFIRDYLDSERYFIASEDLGGNYGRRILFDPATGRVLVKALRTGDVAQIATREQQYVDDLKRQPVAGELELF